MLRTIDPRVTPELLHVLASMGHGDEIALVDVNFPARSVAGARPVVELPGVDAPTAAALILTLLPLDGFVQDPASRMEVVGEPDRLELVQEAVQRAVDRHADRPARLAGVERFAFYRRAGDAFAIVRSGERRFYGCFLFRKGVIPPDA